MGKWSKGNTFLLGKVPKHPEGGGNGAVLHGLTFKNVFFSNLNLKNNLRKTNGGGGLEMFLQRENRKNLMYFHMVS